MWCTRWVLPFLLLPVPITPPIFLLFFLLSLVLHARPCVYCIVFLISLFLSSYYWAPVPTSELGTAVSTLEGLEYNGKPVLSYLPPVIQMLDRSWVDHSYGGLFEPFNVTQWEIDSVRHAVAKAIRAEKKREEELASRVEEDQTGVVDGDPSESSKQVENVPISTVVLYLKTMDAFQRSWFSFLEIIALPRYAYSYGRHLLKTSAVANTSISTPKNKTFMMVREPRKVAESKSLWFGLRSHYDLNPYGFDVVIRLWPVDE